MKEYNTKTLQHGNCTIRIHRPVLTEQERVAEEKRLQEDLTNILTGIYRRKEKTA